MRTQQNSPTTKIVQPLIPCLEALNTELRLSDPFPPAESLDFNKSSLPFKSDLLEAFVRLRMSKRVEIGLRKR